MPYSIARDVCEGIGDCIAACPTECISFATGAVNAKGTRFAVVNPNLCVECGVCRSLCPIAFAVHDSWRPDLVAGADGGTYRYH